MRILLAEDDRAILSALEKQFQRNGFAVDTAENGSDALEFLKSAPYDLAVFDIMMPVMSGLEAVQAARTAGIHTPVIFLTARDALEDRLTGLYAGADDYMTKPFAFEELLARAHALMRRSAVNRPNSAVLTLSDFSLDTLSRKAVRAGREIRLTSREYAICEYLLRNQGTVLTRAQIEGAVLSFDYDGASNMVDVYIRQLRKKIDEGFDKKLIHTVRYAGYVMREDV